MKILKLTQDNGTPSIVNWDNVVTCAPYTTPECETRIRLITGGDWYVKETLEQITEQLEGHQYSIESREVAKGNLCGTPEIIEKLKKMNPNSCLIHIPTFIENTREI